MTLAVDLTQLVVFAKANRLVIGQLIATIGIIGKVFGSFSKISFKKSKSITITILPKHFNEDLLCERHHTDLLFSNSGKLSITKEDVVSPIRFLNGGGNKINDARITSANPEWMSIKTQLADNSLIIDFDLLNHKEYFAIRVYHQGFTNVEPMFRIIGLSKIPVKENLVRNKKLWAGIIAVGIIIMLSPYDHYFKAFSQMPKSIAIAAVTFALSELVNRILNYIEIKKIRRYTRNGKLFYSKAVIE